MHLSRYTLGERELEREVLELFCTQSLIYIERLQTARIRQGLERRRPLAQRLGNERSAPGAPPQPPRSAEALSSEASAEARALRLGEIESSVREAESYIGALLEDR